MNNVNAQLEIAAQWLREGAIALRGKEPSADMYRVADDCERAAGKEPSGESFIAEKKKGRVK